VNIQRPVLSALSSVLALDTAALRCGYAIIEKSGDGYTLTTSGVTGVAREPGELFGVYRTRLTQFWVEELPRLLWRAIPLDIHKSAFIQYMPDKIVMERIPTVGGKNASQRILGQAVATTCEAIAFDNDIQFEYIAANTVKSRLTGLSRATKVQIRNKVLEIFPELVPRKKTILADETDAIGIGLVALGYDTRTKRNGAA
jgi:Holliday junction resolvasome RuvABC endonuclease subunit